MDASTLSIVLTIIYIVSTVIVGLILRTQIKTQTAIIKHLQEQVKLFDTKPLKELQEEQLNLKTSIYSDNLEILQQQNLEMAYYVTQLLDFYEDHIKSKSDEKTRNSIINTCMPSCFKLLADTKSSLTL